MKKKLLCFLLILIMSVPNISFAEEQEIAADISAPAGTGLLKSLKVIPEELDMAENVTVNEFYKVLETLGNTSQSSLQSDGLITGRTIIKELIDLLGYGNLAEAKGGYPNGYLNVANSIKLLKNVNIKNFDNAITNLSMIELLLNALDTPVYDVSGINSNLEVVYEKSEPLLYKLFDVIKLQGVMTATEKSSIYGDSTLEENQIEIDKTVYNADKSYFELLGYSVIAYYNEDTEKVIFAVADEKKNDTVVIKAGNVKSVTTEKIKWLDEGKYYSESINSKIPFVENGVFAGFVSTAWKDRLVPERGTITLIDNNKDKVYDLISIKKYDLYVVERVNTARQMISFKNNKPAINLENSEDNEVIWSLEYMENPATLTDIKEWDVLAIQFSKTTDNKKFYELDIIRRTIEGTFTAYGEDFITIDDEDYKILDDFDLNNIRLGQDYVFVFAGEDDIISYHERDDFVYGYLVEIAKASYYRNSLEMLIVDSAGEEKIYQLDEKIRVNGKKVKSVDLLDDSNFYVNGETNHQLIKYRVEGNAPSEIFTVQHTYEDQNFDGDYFFTNVNRASRMELLESYDMFFSFAPGASIFFVQEPEAGEILDSSDVTVGTLGGDSKQSYDCMFFDVDDGGEANAAIFYNTSGSAAISNTVPTPCFVDRVFHGRDEDDEMRPMISYYYNWSGTLTTAPISDDVQKIDQSAFSTQIDDSRITSLSDLKRGDIIQISKNKDGEIDGFRVLFLIDDALDYGAVVRATTDINSRIDIIYSPIYALKNDKVTVQFSDTEKRTYDLTLSGSAFKSYTIDKYRDNISVKSYKEALSVSETGDLHLADDIVLVTQSGYVRSVLVINK